MDDATRRTTAAYAALVLVQLFFATMPVAGKIALVGLPPLALAAVRVVAGALALLLVARLATGRWAASARDVRTFMLLGVFGVFLNQVLFIAGLDRTTAVNAVLLIATIPAFTYLFAVLRREHAADAVHVAGIVVAFAGVAAIVGAGGLARERLLGDVLVVLNAASYGWYLVLARPLLARHSPATVVAWSFVGGAVGTVLVGLPQLAGVEWGEVSRTTWTALAFIVAFPTIGSYSLNLVALRRLPSRTVAAFIYLQPVVGAALAVAILGETVGPGTLLGAALVFVGVALVTLTRRRKA